MSEESSQKKSLIAHPPKRFLLGSGLVNAVDEAPDFSDPCSDLNLFLSQKIKQEMRHCSNSRKWSVRLQEELIHKITPEFEKKFPRYRLGTHALKKTWEKVSYYSSQIQDQKEALTQDGKLNIPFLIKENLRSFSKSKNSCQLHPYHYAHQLALKMSECIAIVDGARPQVDQLTHAIWSIHRHLIPNLQPDQMKSPYDETDKTDKWIVRKLLEITSKQARISQQDLTFQLRLLLGRIEQLVKDYSPQEIERAAYAIQLEKQGIASGDPLLEKINFACASLIEEEIASALIEKPRRSAAEIASSVASSLEGFSLQLGHPEFERKMQTWTQQGDLVCRWIRLPIENGLFKEIQKLGSTQHLEATVKKAADLYTDAHPALYPYKRCVEQRARTLLKVLWYSQHTDQEASTFDRFIIWHGMLLRESAPESTPEETITSLRLLCQSALPLLPFDPDRAYKLVYPSPSC